MKKSKSRPTSEEYITSNGVTVLLTGLPPLEIPELSQSLPRPAKPTYKITTVAGEVEIHEHDETTLSTDEDRKAWEEYKQKDEAVDAELSSRMLNMILLEGVSVPDNVDLSKWKTRRRLKGLPVSEDPEEMLLQYKKSEVVRSQEDITYIMQRCMELTGIRPEEIEAVKSSFPDNLESVA